MDDGLLIGQAFVGGISTISVQIANINREAKVIEKGILVTSYDPFDVEEGS